ncbi:MAG TPA: YceI family protein [Bacteroidales bacterium]|jgi:hypothetical protein|nr:YceI family protein [Bacteroidales bacterium]
MKRIFGYTLYIFLAVISLNSAGQSYTLTGTNNKAVISGTSSLHEWDENLLHFNSGFVIAKEGAAVRSIDNIIFTCNTRDIKSESSLMDKKTYDALKADEFPQIKFQGTGITGLKSEGAKFSGNLKGKLTLAGQTRDITVPFTGTLIDNNNLDITANAEMSFSDFGMKPPTAMMGALKTGDKVKVSFNLHFSEKR